MPMECQAERRSEGVQELQCAGCSVVFRSSGRSQVSDKDFVSRVALIELGLVL